jgi:hypothetical protein
MFLVTFSPTSHFSILVPGFNPLIEHCAREAHILKKRCTAGRTDRDASRQRADSPDEPWSPASLADASSCDDAAL